MTPAPSLTITFTFDNTQGIWIGTLPSGERFHLVAADIPEEVDDPTLGLTTRLLPFPRQLREALATLARREASLAQQILALRAKPSRHQLPADYASLRDQYLASGGMVQQAGSAQPSP